VRLACGLRDAGIVIEHVDVGGGVGIPYDGGPGLSLDAYAAGILSVVRPSGLALLLEPGRVIMAPAGVLLTRVVDIKSRASGADLAVVDAGMTELIRPALYGAYHRIDPIVRRPGGDHLYEIVGPLCETSDTFGKARPMPPLEVGDVLAVRDAGAYGSVMASNYNRRPFAPEMLVEGGCWRTIRRRQTIDELMNLEQ
jgi:diaminopimelate decarboxylase